MDAGQHAGCYCQKDQEEILTAFLPKRAMGEQARIEIYGSEFCAYCTAARMLLKKKGLHFKDILVSANVEARAEMQQRSGASSVPQILINNQPIGGFDELYELEQSGDLDKLLGAPANVTGD